MEKKYKDIQELARAFANGELDRDQYTLVLDNDESSLRYTGPVPAELNEDEADAFRDRKTDEADKLFKGNGYDDLLGACLAAGIPAEWC